MTGSDERVNEWSQKSAERGDEPNRADVKCLVEHDV